MKVRDIIKAIQDLNPGDRHLHHLRFIIRKDNPIWMCHISYYCFSVFTHLPGINHRVSPRLPAGSVGSTLTIKTDTIT